MQDKVVNFFMNQIKNTNNIDDIKLEEIRYGLLGLYSLITKLLIIISIALILGIFKKFIVFLAFYSILRSVGYGTHANSNLKCWVFSILLLLGVPYLFSYITFNAQVIYTLWFLCFLCFFIFCPADTIKRPMINKKRKLILKIIILIIDLIYVILIILLPNLAEYIIPACLMQAFLSSPIGYIIMGSKSRFSLNIYSFTKQKKKGVN